MKHYFLTFKMLKNQFPSPQLYTLALDYIQGQTNNSVVLDQVFELDTKHKLHYHVLIVCQYIRWAPIVFHMFSEDMYFNFQEVSDVSSLDNVKRYMNKHKIRHPDIVYETQVVQAIENDDYPFID